ncbi:MAG TPA: Stp1/IreP family PP2C-type Ser/Thr phosphatase [Gemmatimonadaceae bacterium]|nr:Stp1/IreP family PP2C-type Ser/Thr phosphatase [Gemmatimonadaceae bacterium]
MTSSPKPARPAPRAERPEVIVHVFGRTDVGRTREHNEDAFLVADLTTGNASLQEEVRTHVVGERGSLFMVADGLGGAAAGEVASEMAIATVFEEMMERWANTSDTDPMAFAAALKAAAEITNQRIYDYAHEHPEHRGLGTTATVAGVLGDTLYLAQVGDSRAYLLRSGKAIQITKDQSLTQRLVEAGELTPEEAERSERRNIILQALGPEPAVKVDLTHQQLRRGDILVLCTDGLSGLVSRDEICEVMCEIPDLVAACRELIDRANEAGGPDNITVVAAQFDGEGLIEGSDEDHVGHAVYALPGESPTGPDFTELDAEMGIRTSEVPRLILPPATRRMSGGPSNRALILAVAALLVLATVLVAVRIFQDPQPAPSEQRPDSAAAGTPARP